MSPWLSGVTADSSRCKTAMRGAVLRSPAERRVIVSSVTGRTGRAPGTILRLTTCTKLARALAQGNAQHRVRIRLDRTVIRIFGSRLVAAIARLAARAMSAVRDVYRPSGVAAPTVWHW